MRKIDEIIIHCSATPEGREVSVAEIDAWHRQRGYTGIGYHYVIHLDGKVEAGRPVDQIGAHCIDHNQRSIGICYIGGCDRQMQPKDTRTAAQREAMARLVKVLADTYGIAPDGIHGHREFAPKDCPCFDVQAWRKEIGL